MRIEEEKFLKNRIYDDFLVLFPNGATVFEYIMALEEGNLQLEIGNKESTQIIDEDSLKKIEGTLPSIRRIISKPHSFIRSKEEKVPVETAKRINCKAISLLSRDSNDWRARTFLTVKPKSVVSDVNEETFDLYENRLVKTLIDLLIIYVLRRRQNLENLYDRLSNEQATTSVENDYRSAYVKVSESGNILMKKLYKPINIVGSKIGSLVDKINRIKKIENELIHFKQSKFYSTLRKSRKVNNPIQKTNIIMFEQDYNIVYQLWQYLNSNHQDEEFTIDDESKFHPENYYYIYSFKMLIASLVDMGYVETTGNIFALKDNHLYLPDSFEFKRGDDSIKIRDDGKELLLEIGFIKEKRLISEKISLKPNYVDFEGKTRADINNITSDIITSLIPNNKKQISASFSLVSLDINVCSEANDFGEKLYRRFFNIGDNYSAHEIGIKKISNYKTGMFIISPIDLRFNFIRFERLINSRVLRMKGFNEKTRTCPLCGSKYIKFRNERNFVCKSCNHEISLSYCSSCGNDMLWIKYVDDSPLKKKEVTEGLEKKPYYFQLKHYESIMGTYAITSFLLEKEKNEWKLKSLCPHCGVKLGE